MKTNFKKPYLIGTCTGILATVAFIFLSPLKLSLPEKIQKNSPYHFIVINNDGSIDSVIHAEECSGILNVIKDQAVYYYKKQGEYKSIKSINN